MSDDDPLLHLADVEVHFEEESGLLDLRSDPDVVRAVDGVTMAIEERDVVALVGESGCGKTTLGKTAIGLQRPTAGTVAYRGHDIWAVREGASDAPVTWSEIRSSLQIVHQDPGSSLNPNRTVRAILAEPIKQVNPELSRGERRERIFALLERVGIAPAPDYAGRYPHQLSGGEQQRVALGRALLMGPDVILADEAISALDVSLRVEMMDLMLELREEFDTAFLFVSHDLSNARYFTAHGDGKLGVMYLGQVAEFGPAEDVLSDPGHPYTEVLTWATPDLRLRSVGDPPMRAIDVPDPVDPPSGCRFHTRCPEARHACTLEQPRPYAHGDQRVRCFREDDGHVYWDSPDLTDGETGSEDDRIERESGHGD